MTHDVNSRPWASVAPNGPILRPSEAAAYLGLSINSYYVEARIGRVPAPVKITSRATGIPRAWLDAVVADRVAAGGR